MAGERSTRVQETLDDGIVKAPWEVGFEALQHYRANLTNGWETLKGEHLKTAAEFGLHVLPKSSIGRWVIEQARGGERIVDPRLHTEVAGIQFENPLMVGAGWDKKGWAIDGLYELGFAGTELGSVLAYRQRGGPQPRLFYKDGAGLNRLGFNSLGKDAVADYLDEPHRGVVGISLGKNKIAPKEHAPWAHAVVAETLFKYADYFVINLASPNTPELRDMLKNPEILTSIIQAVQETNAKKARELNVPEKPIFLKTMVDLTLAELDTILEICIRLGLTGIIDSNTTVNEELKALYGWGGQMGGLSGDVEVYRQRCGERMRYITRATRGTGLQRVGVGAINDAESAIERMEDGAQLVQVVTGVRQRKAKIARDINLGILDYLKANNLSSVEQLVGIAA